MRITKVDFQRFLGFKNVSIELDPSLQLVAGPNNAGKSTLVRLLELFFSDPSSKVVMEHQPLNEYYSSEGPRALSRITVHFGNLSDTEEQIFAPIIRKSDNAFSISLRATRTGRISFETSKKPNAEDARRYYEEVLNLFRYVKIPSIRLADGKIGETDSLERLIETLEAVLIRKGSARSTSLQQRFTEKMTPVESLVREVLDQSASAIKDDLPFQENVVSFRLPDPSHALRGMLSEAVIESHGSLSLPVSQRGTGFQSALVLGILRYVAETESQTDGNILFSIEEPEAFLHPQTQRAMAKIIRDISADAQVIMTTHSSVLIDSFNVESIVRLPLQPEGLELKWIQPDLEPAESGRLTRYCSAANSELIFANAVIFVEGESDFSVMEKILSNICGGPGGHYALGITVIEATGLSKIRYLVQLAELFGVRSYVLADRDSLHKHSGKRELVSILEERSEPMDPKTMNNMRNTADKWSANLDEALENQKDLNRILEPFDIFVLSSDLEGLLLDIFGFEGLVTELGPDGLNEIDEHFVKRLLVSDKGREELASWLGSKGWNSKGNKSGKLPPHIPAILISRWLDRPSPPGNAAEPLINWIAKIVTNAAPAPV